MAFGKQLTAEEILGMKPEDFRAKMDGAVTKDDLTAATAKIEEQGNTLAEIKASLAKLTTPVAQPDPNFVADLEDPTTQMLTDPAGYVARQTLGLQNTALETKAQLLEMRARSKYAGAFQKYDKELTDGAARFSIAQRAQDSFWDFHVATLTGQKVLAGEFQGGSYPSLMGNGSYGANVSEPIDPNSGFDPQVSAFLKERGVPLEKAALIKKAMDNGEPVDINTYKKAAA